MKRNVLQLLASQAFCPSRLTYLDLSHSGLHLMIVGLSANRAAHIMICCVTDTITIVESENALERVWGLCTSSPLYSMVVGLRRFAKTTQACN